LGQTTYSTNVDITGHINTFGAEHTLLLDGDVYRLIVGTFSNVLFGATSQIDLFNPIPPATTFPCPCFPGATSFTQDTAGLDLQDQVKLPYNLYLLAGLRYQYL
jgi:iron complex outermembrane recepter protein